MIFVSGKKTLKGIATTQETQTADGAGASMQGKHAPRANDVVQEEAGGLLYALLFVLCCNFALRL